MNKHGKSILRAWTRRDRQKRSDKRNNTTALASRLHSLTKCGNQERTLTSVCPVAMEPPKPPLQPTPLLACTSNDNDILLTIAQSRPELRQWIAANPHANATVLEYISQVSGPRVREAFAFLFDEEC